MDGVTTVTDSGVPPDVKHDDVWLTDIIRCLQAGLDHWEGAHQTGPGTWTYPGADGPFHEVTQSTLRRLKQYRTFHRDAPTESEARLMDGNR